MRIAGAAMKGAVEFLPLGSGLGTFRDAFRRYQPEGIPGYVDHAHNGLGSSSCGPGVLPEYPLRPEAVHLAVTMSVLGEPGSG